MGELVEFVELCSLLRGGGWHVPDCLSVGLERAAVESRFAAHGLDPMRLQEAVLFFCEQDGLLDQELTLDQMQLIPGYYPLSLSEALDTFEILKVHPTWGQRLFPLFADGMGYFLVVQENADAERSNAVWELIEGYFPALVFHSVEDMFRTYCQALRNGVVYIDKEKFLEIDRPRFRGLARTMNPGVEFWQS